MDPESSPTSSLPAAAIPESTETETEPPQPFPQASAIEKLPPRPAPTWGYSWTEWSANAKLIYLRDTDEANERLSHLQPGCIGFDLEWKPTYVKGGQENRVALVQIANDDMIFLVQISAMQEFPSKLREILEDPAFLKAGVGIQGDTKKLFTDWEVSVRGCIDLSLLARSVDTARWKGKYNSSIGLARLVEVYCYRLLGKGKITRSNWELFLKPPQQQYAANDAHAGYIVCKRLLGMIQLSNPPEPKYYTFDCVRGYYCEPTGLPWSPINPTYDPGPAPPPKPHKDRRDRRRVDKGGEAGSPAPDVEAEEQPIDPTIIVQRHESVLKLAHSTWLRQQETLGRGRNQDSWSFQPNAFQIPEPLHTTSSQKVHHSRHNSYSNSTPTSTTFPTAESSSSVPASPPQRPRNNHPNATRGASYNRGFRGNQFKRIPTRADPPAVAQPQVAPGGEGSSHKATDMPRPRYRQRRPKPSNPQQTAAAIV